MEDAKARVLSLLGELLDSKTDEAALRVLRLLKPLVVAHSLRFDVLFERSYYCEMVEECQRMITLLVEDGSFELAARARDEKYMYLQKVREIDDHFGSRECPAFTIDQNGLVRCYLDYRLHNRTIRGILLIS